MPIKPTKKKASRTSQKVQKTARRHRASTAGKVKLPLDVRSEKDLPLLKKLLGKKPLTIIMVYATWCPHCHTMMPHFDAAAKSPQNTVSPVKINETMMNSVNQYIQKNVNHRASPIRVDGYPSILLINQKAEKVADVETKRDTAYLTKVMEESGNLAKQAGINESLTSTAPMPNKMSLNKKSVQRSANAEEVVEDVVENELLPTSTDSSEKAVNSMNLLKNNKNMKNVPTLASISVNANAPSLQPAITINSLRNRGNTNSLKPSKEMEKKADELFSLESPVAPIPPPSMGSDMDEDVIISNTLSPEQKVGGGSCGAIRGGSLAQAMVRTTYTLAPAAALLATAAMVMKKRGTFKKSAQKRHKSHKNHKKSVKRRN